MNRNHSFYQLTALNESNIEELVGIFRELLVGKRITVIKHEYCDSKSARIRVQQGVRLRADWTDGSNELIRLFKKGQMYTPVGEFAVDRPHEIKGTYFSYSLGGYSYSAYALEGDTKPEEKEDKTHFLTPHFRVGREDGEWIIEEYSMAPAGPGCLHYYQYVPIHDVDYDRLAELVDEYWRDKRALIQVRELGWSMIPPWLRSVC